jgi:UDP-N-acetylmuramyl pentapeptide phosphotransferase/UDP-N-acetylglucosamine-1-phosphate transferase
LQPDYQYSIHQLAIAIPSGIRISVTFGTPIDPMLSMLLTVLWVVGITNAINLMDGMDGLAAGANPEGVDPLSPCPFPTS